MRRGSEVLHFFERDDIGLWLGTFHDIKSSTDPDTGMYYGDERDYNQVSRFRISEELFEQLKKESELNKEQWRSNSNEAVDEKTRWTKTNQ